jgi:hypothetical protein
MSYIDIVLTKTDSSRTKDDLIDISDEMLHASF